MLNPAPGGESDQRTGLATLGLSKLGDKIREIVVELPDIANVAALAGTAMAPDIRHVDRDAGGTQRRRQIMHAGSWTGRAVHQNGYFIECRARCGGIGVILQAGAIACLEVPRRRKIGADLGGRRRHGGHHRRGDRCIEQDHGSGDRHYDEGQNQQTGQQFAHIASEG
jgi:hypothetical protein